MKPEIKSEWIRRLESDEYKQGRGRLRRDDTYCCLGVLADQMGARWIREHRLSEEHSEYISLSEEHPEYVECIPYVAEFGGEQLVEDLGQPILEIVGLSYEQEYDLVRLNDNGASFRHIADWIKTHC